MTKPIINIICVQTEHDRLTLDRFRSDTGNRLMLEIRADVIDGSPNVRRRSLSDTRSLPARRRRKTAPPWRLTRLH